MTRSTANSDAARTPVAPDQWGRSLGRHQSTQGSGKEIVASLARGCRRAGRHAQRQPRPRSRSGLQYRDRVEPDRGEYAGRAPGAGGRSAAFCPDPHGDGAGRRLRRGQRDRAEALPAVSPRSALLGNGLAGGGCRDCRVRSPHEHRLDGAQHPVPDAGRAVLQTLAQPIQRLARCDTGLAVQDAGDRGRERCGRCDDRRRQNDGRFGPSQWVPNSGARALAAALNPTRSRPDHHGWVS